MFRIEQNTSTHTKNLALLLREAVEDQRAYRHRRGRGRGRGARGDRIRYHRLEPDGFIIDPHRGNMIGLMFGRMEGCVRRPVLRLHRTVTRTWGARCQQAGVRPTTGRRGLETRADRVVTARAMESAAFDEHAGAPRNPARAAAAWPPRRQPRRSVVMASVSSKRRGCATRRRGEPPLVPRSTPTRSSPGSAAAVVQGTTAAVCVEARRGAAVCAETRRGAGVSARASGVTIRGFRLRRRQLHVLQRLRLRRLHPYGLLQHEQYPGALAGAALNAPPGRRERVVELYRLRRRHLRPRGRPGLGARVAAGALGDRRPLEHGLLPHAALGDRRGRDGPVPERQDHRRIQVLVQVPGPSGARVGARALRCRCIYARVSP